MFVWRSQLHKLNQKDAPRPAAVGLLGILAGVSSGMGIPDVCVLMPPSSTVRGMVVAVTHISRCGLHQWRRLRRLTRAASDVKPLLTRGLPHSPFQETPSLQVGFPRVWFRFG